MQAAAAGSESAVAEPGSGGGETWTSGPPNVQAIVMTAIRDNQVVSAAVLADLRRRMFARPPETSGVERLGDFEVRINDGPNFYILCKDIFVKRYYHFEAKKPAPIIIDGGGNIGLSVLYFKLAHPDARITTFEPDRAVLPLLRENLGRNGLSDVRIVEAALGARTEAATFHSDGKYGGSLAGDGAGAVHSVQCVRLRDYLVEPIDFLKLNIEGAEWGVLADSEDRLANVPEMVVEYHHLPGLPRTLHKILDLLDRCGFDYLVNDFDEETNPGVRSPFRLGSDSRYFLLLYARRRG